MLQAASFFKPRRHSCQHPTAWIHATRVFLFYFFFTSSLINCNTAIHTNQSSRRSNIFNLITSLRAKYHIQTRKITFTAALFCAAVDMNWKKKIRCCKLSVNCTHPSSSCGGGTAFNQARRSYSFVQDERKSCDSPTWHAGRNVSHSCGICFTCPSGKEPVESARNRRL